MMHQTDTVTVGEDQAPTQLVIALAQALHTSGVPAHELEERMEAASRILKAPADIFSTPTSIFLSFAGPEQKTHLVRVTPASTNLHKLSLLHHLLDEIETDCPPAEAIWTRVEKLEESGPNYGPVTTVASFGVAAGTAAVFFRGGVNEGVAATTVGLLVGAIVIGCSRYTPTRHLIDMTAAFVATLASTGATWMVPTLSSEIVMVGSLIILLPGLGVTVAINELATQNLASGTARLAGACTTFLTMAFGIVIGRGLLQTIFKLPANEPEAPLPVWCVGLSLVLTSVAFAVLFRARLRDTGWILLAATTAYCGARLGGTVLGVEAAAWTGAFLLGIAGNIFGRILRRPPATMLVPGMILLVPGSYGFFSLTALVKHDVDYAIETAFTMSLVAASIVAGLLMSNVLVRSR